MVDSIKRICFDVVSDLALADSLIGEVVSDKPVSIKVSDKLIISQNQLIISRNLSNFSIEINQNPEFPDNPYNSVDFENKKICFVYNELKTGDNVILFKTSGGQSYFVIDKIVPPSV